MVDVDLSVRVTNAGVEKAINVLNSLRETGERTGKTLAELSKASERANASMTRAFNNNSVGVLKNQENAVKSLTVSLREQEEAYRRTASMNVGASPARRLRLGFDTLEDGKAAARHIKLMREAYNADPVRDLMAVQQQELRLLEQRAQKLADLASKQRAQASLGRAREDLTNQRNGITAVEQAQIRLKRATEDLTRAQQASAAVQGATRAANGQFVNQYAAQAAAARAEARAVRELTAATRELQQARQSVASDHSNAFQSSFPYFIIAGMAQQATQAILSVGGAAVTASSEIERSFADVERTFEGTDVQLTSLQDRLKSLATDTPVSVTDLAQIATLGNQLGIAAQDIESFTTTIAQYTAVSGQSAEDAATAFGRISNLTGLAASEYSNLASAITYVARTTVATESTIQNTAKEITALASGAGFSADAIVGLAGALSSLAIPPERARGALSLYFGALNEAVAEGGPKMAAFSEVTGKTVEELNALVRENRGQEVFTAFITGLSRLDTVAKTSALDTLGLSTIRVDQTMRALAQNVPLVTDAFAGANQAFLENTEIANQYAIIQDTLASKIIELQNSIQLAAGAVGDALAPALMTLIGLVTDIIVNFTAFAETPLGATLLTLAGLVTGLVLVIGTLIGALALVKAGLTVIPFALTGIGANAAGSAIGRFTAGLIGMNLTVTNGTVGLTRMNGVLSATGATSWAATAGFTALKAAIAATGIGLGIVLVGTLVSALTDTAQSAGLAAENIAGLAEAIKADTATYNETGKAVATFGVEAAGSAAEQDKAANASRNWANVLGTDLVAGAEAAADAVSKIAAGDQVVEAFRAALGDDEEVEKIISDSKFASEWQRLGLNMTELIAAGLQSGGDKGVLLSAIDEMLGGVEKRVVGSGFGARVFYYDKTGKDITSFYNQLLDLNPLLASTATEMQGTANKGLVLSDAVGGIQTQELTDGFLGASESLSKFQDALSSALGQAVGFKEVKDILDGIAKEQAGDDVELLKSLVNAPAFADQLDAANQRAVDFFNGITQLADSGASEFATQLAGLGVGEGSGLLASALTLDGAGQARLEESARFAAFLASDAFKAAFEANMQDTTEAYARIFKTTGNLDDVKSYIAAQVAGTGEEWERQWAILHPEVPLNVTPELRAPSDAEIEIWRQMSEGRLTVSAKVQLDPMGRATGDSKVYTDELTGASITLPADLDGQALTESLAYWSQNQNDSPEEIAAALNTEGFGGDIEVWKQNNGPVTVYATLVPLNSLTGSKGVGGPGFSQGGPVDYPRYAGGGVLRGPGSGTSDSFLAAVSNGEYINTAASRKFWGTDFFDSLNKQMLPSSFVNMLGAAAVSGNRGPEQVVNVNVALNNPLTRDPYKQLREKSEKLMAGIW